tara:strand:- start:942 stop:1103 length:162 start_codon:yes stop_codon:yes gene_type:complete
MDVDNIRTNYSHQGKNQLIAYYIDRCEALESKIQFLEAQLDVVSLNSNKYNEI